MTGLNRYGGDDESPEGKEEWRSSQLTEGHAHEQGRDQQDGTGGQSPCSIVVVVPVAVALVGPVTVVTETTLHLGSGAAAVSFVAETLVRARLHHRVGSRDGGAGVGILRTGGGALSVAVLLIRRHARVTFEGVAVAGQRDEQQQDESSLHGS